jgi:Uma2 family endonuclease
MEAIDTLNPIHRISVDQFHRMITAGLFNDGDRVELIDGEMRDMPPIGSPHNSCTNTLNMLFASALAGQAIVSIQGPLVLDGGTELYPDLTVLKLRPDRYRQANPTGDDTHLVIEVADSSLSLDLQIKLPKYAQAGVPRYWVVDIKGRTIHDYRDLDRLGHRYRQLRSVTEGAAVFRLEAIDVPVDLSELFSI